MNQILDIDDSNKKIKKEKKVKTGNSGPLEIDTILKFFAIAILIFGICMIGTGSYSMYKSSNKQVAKTKPVIYVEQTEETEILLRVTSDKELSTISYNWNNEGETQVPADGKREIETKIQIPTGTNTLHIYAKDINGQEIEHSNVYTVESDININIEPEGNDLKITANGLNQLQYMTYRWDEDEETRIDIEGTEVEEIIEIPKGLHKLTVIVVDINNKTETKEQDVNGVTKPNEAGNIVIKTSDDQGIKRVEIVVNDDKEYFLDLQAHLDLEARKEFEYEYPLNGEENKIEIKVYNENDLTESITANINRQ